MKRTSWVGPLLLLIALGCGDLSAPTLSSWSASPAALEMAVGETDTLTITLLTDAGQAFPSNPLSIRCGNVDNNSYLGCDAYPSLTFTITRVSPLSDNPVLLEVSAHVAMSDTIRIYAGSFGGCPDPPLCTGATWHDDLPPLKVGITIR